MATQDKGTSNRGFASMDKEKQREIAAQGGRASHGNDSTSSRGGSSGKSSSSSSTRGGSSEQHAKAGSQSHKNR